MKTLFAILSFFASVSFADTAVPLSCPKASCPQQSGTTYAHTNAYPQSIDGNGTVTAYVDVVSIAGFGRNGHRADAWYTVQWDNTGALTSVTFDQNGGSGYSYSPGPNGFVAPIPEPGNLTCCTVSNGYQMAYADYVTHGQSYWQTYLDTP